MVNAGAIITFTVQGTTGGYLPRSTAGVRTDVIDRLSPFFDVQDVSIVASSVLSDPLHSLSNWPYVATVRASVRADYGDIRDVDSIVANAFDYAAGQVPTVTANGYEQAQGAAAITTGLSVTTALILAIVFVGLVVAVKLT